MKHTHTLNTRNYPTDLTDYQWQVLHSLLPERKGRGRPPKYSRRDIINAILYVKQTGCQWRMLPRDFPKWMTVYITFWRWRNDGTWERIHDALRGKVREAAGKKANPTAGIIDSQTVRTTEAGGEKGYDAGKKMNGRKRHIVVDTLGMLLSIVIHPADLQDNDGACLTLLNCYDKLPNLKVIFGDSAYKRSGLPEFIKSTLGWILQPVLRPVGISGFIILSKRWIVERTLAWISRARRNAKDYERSVESGVAMVHITMIHLMLKRLEKAEY